MTVNGDNTIALLVRQWGFLLAGSASNLILVLVLVLVVIPSGKQ